MYIVLLVYYDNIYRIIYHNSYIYNLYIYTAVPIEMIRPWQLSTILGEYSKYVYILWIHALYVTCVEYVYSVHVVTVVHNLLHYYLYSLCILYI